MKMVLILAGIVIIGATCFLLYSPAHDSAIPTIAHEHTDESDASEIEDVIADRSAVTDGTYTVDTELSTLRWAGQKPLIEGYVNSGSISIDEGEILVADGSARGQFKIDMNTLSVFSTPTKEGKESLLETHLKGDRWFAVEEFPVSEFVITNVAPRADSESTFMYDITGQLTMKGVTNELLFPATIFLNKKGLLEARADLEFDRTLWGITASSDSFFDNLADNAVDDMVTLSFELIAHRQ